jgi:hypothetical protein
VTVRQFAALAAVVCVAAVAAAPAGAAAPRYILVSGPGLERPVLLGDWGENLELVSALLPAKRPGAGWRSGRTRYDLALFWGVPAKPVPTDPRYAAQHAWFFPAAFGRRAVFDILLGGRRFPRVATSMALQILARHGVPTRTS